MSPALLALFARALREDVRSKFMYWARAGLVGFVLLSLGSTQARMGWGGAPGLKFFESVIWINLLFISLAGLSYFASAITEEKEEMTLGLLRMTNLNPLSILLGKSASRQVGALLLLASQLPFTLLAVSLGGVSLGQILAAYASLAAYLLLLGNVALFFSVMVRQTTQAAILTAVTVLAIFFLPYLLHGLFWKLDAFQWAASIVASPSWKEFLATWSQASPISRLQDIFRTGFQGTPGGFQVVSNCVIGFIFFLGAWALFNVFCSEQPDAAPRRGLLVRGGKRWSFFSAGRPWRRSALAWKDFYFLSGGRVAVVVKLLLYGGLLSWVFAEYRSSPFADRWFGYFVFWAMWIALTIESAFIASRVFRQEQRWKTWSSLAMLPVSIRRIAYQKILGCLLSTWPALLFLLGGLLLISDELFKGFGGGRIEFLPITAFLFGFLELVFFYHLVASLSLRLKWGALPLSIGLVWVGSIFVVMISGMIFREAVFVVLDPALIILIILLHFQIGKRLELIAAEG